MNASKERKSSHVSCIKNKQESGAFHMLHKELELDQQALQE